jgi:hypothetical protein
MVSLSSEGPPSAFPLGSDVVTRVSMLAAMTDGVGLSVSHCTW